MAENRPKYMNWILECINLLRSRKSRPDLERICRTMLKCHGIEEKDTEEDLRALVQAGVVTRRSFKGAISYRNSAGWNRTHGPGKVSRAGRWVSEAIRTLDRGLGASAQDIERYVAAKHPYYNNLKPRIKLALKDDIEHGRIWLAGEGMYRLLESAESPEREICTTEPICDFCLQTSECNRNGEFENLLICRDCGNKAHPSCMNYSTDLTSRIRDDAGSWQCIDCKTCVICNDSGDPGSLLFCDACDKGYHMQCHVPPLESMPIGKWICYNCENHPTNPARLEENNGVIDIRVHRDPSTHPLSGRLSSTSGPSYLQDEDMEECLVEVKDMHVQVDAENVQRELEMLTQSTPPCTPPSSSVTPTNGESSSGKSDKDSTTAQQGENSSKDNSASANKPDVKNMAADASKWEVADVITFLESAGFTEESKNFKEQEIDGAALLLMSRNDVLTGMSLKLGPALKIYSHVSKLQRCQPKTAARSSTH